MTNIILSGCNGHMGRVITSCADGQEDLCIVAGADLDGVMLSHFPVFTSLGAIHYEADVLIDFSHASALDGILKYARDNKIALVLCSTGYSAEQRLQIEQAAAELPLFFSFNMSLGVSLLAELCKKAAAVLEGFDVEIVEKHHNQKLDAPSGTAVMLAEAVNEGRDEPLNQIYDRSQVRQKRLPDEIGMHSIRGGTIVGEHDIIFAGRDEIVTLSHSARSKEIFAVGALRAARFMAGKPSGLYTMKDLID